VRPTQYLVLASNGGGISLDQILSILFFVMLTLYFLTDIPQRLQFYRYSKAAASRLAILESLVNEGIAKVKSYIAKIGFENPDQIIAMFIDNYFMINPVDIEPIDIIRRMGHLIENNEVKFKTDLARQLPKLGREALNNMAVSIAIASALYEVYKILRHYYLLGKKYENWILLMQLSVILPQIVKELTPYVKAIEGIAKGVPIGDSVGPLVAFKLAGLSPRIEIVEDTVVSVVDIEGRRVYVIKAKGPGATVGKPGKAVAKLVEDLKCNVSRIITIDAALKLEGERTGQIAEGSGAAIGDPGPEKIEIERAAVKCGAPLDAIIIKMSNEEAIKPMSKELSEAAEKAYERVLELIRTRTRPGDNVIVVGVGNSVGVY